MTRSIEVSISSNKFVINHKIVVTISVLDQPPFYYNGVKPDFVQSLPKINVEIAHKHKKTGRNSLHCIVCDRFVTAERFNVNKNIHNFCNSVASAHLSFTRKGSNHNCMLGNYIVRLLLKHMISRKQQTWNGRTKITTA